MRLPRFQYPVTRDFSGPFTIILLIVGVLWTSFITFAIVVAVGYEYVPVWTTTFNSSMTLWYENRFPWTSRVFETKICQPAELQVTESMTHLFIC
jgi:hypothetical protein